MSAVIDAALPRIEGPLASIDGLRRSLAGGEAPLAEVYLEAARGNLHHARAALLNYARRAPTTGQEGVVLEPLPGGALCLVKAPAGWSDEAHPARPDLGADLVASTAARSAASLWHAGGMIEAALADHAWLHLGSGVSWSTDLSGARALIGALNGGRPVARYDVASLAGTLEEETVFLLASLGWRRLRSPTWNVGTAT